MKAIKRQALDELFRSNYTRKLITPKQHVPMGLVQWASCGIAALSCLNLILVIARALQGELQ